MSSSKLIEKLQEVTVLMQQSSAELEHRVAVNGIQIDNFERRITNTETYYQTVCNAGLLFYWQSMGVAVRPEDIDTARQVMAQYTQEVG